MKIRHVAISAMFIISTHVSVLPAFAADQDARIKQCVVDNKDEKQKPEAVSSYCTCMAGKMPDTEKASVTEWESSHTDEQGSCAAGANWNMD